MSGIYPFSKLDQVSLDEVYKKIETKVFTEGSIIKDYGDYPKEVYIIFSGEAEVIS